MTAKKKTGDTKSKEKKTKDTSKGLSPAQIRFVYLYLGGYDGNCWNNATLSYFYAYNDEDTPLKNADGTYSKQYLTAKAEGSSLLAKPSIRSYMEDLLTGIGYDPKAIKRRYAELASQNKNLPVALQANDRMAKVAGVIRDDPTKVNIPELEAVAAAIRKVLG